MNLFSLVGDRLKQEIECSDSENEQHPKARKSKSLPGKKTPPPPANPQMSANPTSKSPGLLGRVSNDTLYLQVNYPNSPPSPFLKDAHGNISHLTHTGTRFLDSLQPHLTRKDPVRCQSPVAPKQDTQKHAPFDDNTWKAEKQKQMADWLAYQYQHSQYHNTLPANWSNNAEDSDRDAEGKTDNKSAMDLDTDVGSSHPNVGSSSRPPNLSKSLYVKSQNYPPPPANKSIEALFTPHPASVRPVPKSLAEIVIPRIAHSITEKTPSRQQPNTSQESSQSEMTPFPQTSKFLQLNTIKSFLPVCTDQLSGIAFARQCQSVPCNSLAVPTISHEAQLQNSKQKAQQYNDCSIMLSDRPYCHSTYAIDLTSPSWT